MIFRRSLDGAIAFVACAIVVALLVCVSLGVITRALDDPLIWTDEVSRFLMVWLAAFGWMMASRKRAHVRIRYFVDKLPHRARRAAEMLLQAAVAVLGILVAWYCVDLVGRNWDVEATTVPLPIGLMYVPMLLAGLVTALQAGAEVWQAATRAAFVP